MGIKEDKNEVLIFIIVLIIIFISPILIAVLVRAKNIKQANEYTTEQLVYLTTFQNNNISNEDIMKLFSGQCHLYLSQPAYCIYSYKVYQEEDKQNYAWHVKTVKNVYSWGTFYNIEFFFSNGFFTLEVSNQHFNRDGKESRFCNQNMNILMEIDIALSACCQQAFLMWKMYKKQPMQQGQWAGTPFSFFRLVDNEYATMSEVKNDFEENRNNDSKKINSKNNKSIPNDIYELLKVFDVEYPNTDMDLLKRNYHNMLSRYHPDKVEHLGDDLKKIANQRTKEIIEAYNKVLNWIKGENK
jgi:hypothetical protein